MATVAEFTLAADAFPLGTVFAELSETIKCIEGHVYRQGEVSHNIIDASRSLAFT